MEKSISKLYVKIEKREGLFDIPSFLDHFEGKLAIVSQSLACFPSILTDRELTGLKILVDDVCDDLLQFQQQLGEAGTEYFQWRDPHPLEEEVSETNQ